MSDINHERNEWYKSSTKKEMINLINKIKKRPRKRKRNAIIKN